MLASWQRKFLKLYPDIRYFDLPSHESLTYKIGISKYSSLETLFGAVSDFTQYYAFPWRSGENKHATTHLSNQRCGTQLPCFEKDQLFVRQKII